MGTILTTMYLHADREGAVNLGSRLGLRNEALQMFSYACTEVKVGLEVNEETGEATVVSVDGRRVAR